MDKILQVDFSSNAQFGGEGWDVSISRENTRTQHLHLTTEEFVLVQTKLRDIFPGE